MTKPKIKAAQLQRGYKAPHAKDGARQHLPGGVLVTKPSFTSSASKAEARLAARPANTDSSTGYATSVAGTDDPTPWNNKRKPLGGACKPIPNGGRVGYTKPIALDSDANKIIRGHTPSLRRWCSLLAEGVPVPLEVAAALRHAGAYDIYSLYGDD